MFFCRRVYNYRCLLSRDINWYQCFTPLKNNAWLLAAPAYFWPEDEDNLALLSCRML